MPSLIDEFEKERLVFELNQPVGLYKKAESHNPVLYLEQSTQLEVEAKIKRVSGNKYPLVVLPGYHIKYPRQHSLNEVIYDHVTGFPRFLRENSNNKHYYNLLGDYESGLLAFKGGKVDERKHRYVNFLWLVEQDYIGDELMEILQKQRYYFQQHLGEHKFKRYQEQTANRLHFYPLRKWISDIDL